MPSYTSFFRFCVVGTIGFITDATVLALLLENGVSHYVARILSFPVAVFATWWLNRVWTFSTANRTRTGRQIVRYFTVQILGAIVNLMTYLLVLLFIEKTVVNALFALSVGSAAGLVVNYLGARRLVFLTN
ncbi:GtrA family protein [Ruegeria profundi]|uniref:GtrA family protein n=1 Tax=Ruegeria profundi TaxID=1685378 RepID=UPI003C7E3E3E